MKDLIQLSIQAQKDYVVNRIDSPTGKLYYTEMIDLIQTIIQTCENYNLSLAILYTAFSKLREGPFSLNRELKYKKLALKHVSETIIAINKRFNGYVKS